MDPCGTPDVTAELGEQKSLAVAYWLRFERNSLIHASTLGSVFS